MLCEKVCDNWICALNISESKHIYSQSILVTS